MPNQNIHKLNPEAPEMNHPLINQDESENTMANALLLNEFLQAYSLGITLSLPEFATG